MRTSHMTLPLKIQGLFAQKGKKKKEREEKKERDSKFPECKIPSASNPRGSWIWGQKLSLLTKHVTCTMRVFCTWTVSTLVAHKFCGYFPRIVCNANNVSTCQKFRKYKINTKSNSLKIVRKQSAGKCTTNSTNRSRQMHNKHKLGMNTVTFLLTLLPFCR